MRFLKGFGVFWYDFVIGDDWKIAVAVAAVLLAGALLLWAGLAHAALAIACGSLFLGAFTAALLLDARS